MKIIKYFIFLLLTIAPKLFSQEIVATVNVNMEQIIEEKRQNVASMANDVEKYINNQRFTDIQWDGPPIPVDITIVLSGGYNNRYTGQVFIASKRYIHGQAGGTSVTMKLIDKEWSFEYNMGAMFSYNSMRYNEFSSVLDYYMLLIIGFDSDTYAELDGTKSYDKARQICQLGSAAGADGFKTISKPGEFTRYSLINELTDLRYEPLRKIIYGYYADGLDLMKEDKPLAMKTIAYLIGQLADFKQKKLTSTSIILTAFFDAKALELAELFKGNKEFKSVFKDLSYLDPTNTMIYNAAAEGK